MRLIAGAAGASVGVALHTPKAGLPMDERRVEEA